jgi:hypothetical protein
MGWFRRISVSLGVAVAMLASVAVASVGAAGGFGSSGGHFVFNDLSATVSTFNPVDQSSDDISVDRSLYMLRPRAGGPLQTQQMTVLSISVFVPNPDPAQPPILADFGCFVIPDSDFVVSSNLQTATLNATVDESNFCPGFLVPLTGAEPAKGGGGGGGGFTFPLTVTATWTGTGVVATQDDQGSFRCQSFVSLTHNHFLSAASSNVTADISGVLSFSGGQPDVFGFVQNGTFVNEVAGSGIISAACGGKG